jgi:endonuclease/exonuclease/phosphatase family metal-dependent hydrolase
MGRTNTLTVKTFGISITGIRVPAYTAATDWYRYWEWLNENLDGDIAIGDFNADPGRPRKWDRVLETLMQCGGWHRTNADGDWSYKGNNGSTSRVDHVLSRGKVNILSARYVTDPFVPAHTDHAALLAEIAN